MSAVFQNGFACVEVKKDIGFLDSGRKAMVILRYLKLLDQ